MITRYVRAGSHLRASDTRFINLGHPSNSAEMSRPSSKLDELTEENRVELINLLHQRQTGKCFICGEGINLQLDEVDIDHIVPLSSPFKGVDDEENWAVSHAKHNRSKGTRSLQLMRYIFEYTKLRDSYVNQNKDFTVGDALDYLVPQRQEVYVELRDSIATISYVGSDGISKKENFQLEHDSGTASFFGMIPFTWIYHDKNVNPRSIADLEPMDILSCSRALRTLRLPTRTILAKSCCLMDNTKPPLSCSITEIDF